MGLLDPILGPPGEIERSISGSAGSIGGALAGPITGTEETQSLPELAIDVPADAVNATTGTGENLGFFGEVDRALDPRIGPDTDVAEPTEETTGVSGFARGLGGATGGVAEGVGQTFGSVSSGLFSGLTSTTGGIILLLAVAVFAFGQLFDVQVG